MAVVKCLCGNYWNTQPARANWVKTVRSCRKCAPDGPKPTFDTVSPPLSELAQRAMTGMSSADKAKAEFLRKKRA